MIWRAGPGKRSDSVQPGRALPTVTVVVAVRNEVTRIVDRVENLFAQEYPASLLTVIVAGNGCTDGTLDACRTRLESEDRLRVVESDAAAGKAGSLNKGVAAASGEIIVFADARQRFSPGTIRALVDALHDPDVGAASGRLRIGSAAAAAVEGVRGYWEIETRLRWAESETGTMIGCTGAVYAVRRALYQPHPPGLILDDVLTPMRVVLQGYRVAMVPEAIAWDQPSGSSRQEFGRKVRTLAGNLQILKVEPRLLSPRKNPAFVRYVSHRILRLFAPICLLLSVPVGLTSPWLPVRIAAAGLGALYVVGGVGLITSYRRLAGPAALTLVSLAAAKAVFDVFRGSDSFWERPAATRE